MNSSNLHHTTKIVIIIPIIVFITLFLCSSKGWAQTTVYFQGFENGSLTCTENWDYNGGNVNTELVRTGSKAARVGRSGESNTITFDAVNVSGLATPMLQIFHAVRPLSSGIGKGEGMDTREGAVIQVKENSGTWNTIGQVDGDNNFAYGYNSIGGAGKCVSTCPNPLTYPITAGTSTIQLRVLSIKSGGSGCSTTFANDMSNPNAGNYDRSDEGFFIDDIEITTTSTIPDGFWTGNTSTDWFDCTNWQNSKTPLAATNVTINQTATRDCVVGTGAAVCNDITLSSSSIGRSLTVQGTSSLNCGGNVSVTKTLVNNNVKLTLLNSATFSCNNLLLTGFGAGNENAQFENEISTSVSATINGNLTINSGGKLDLTNGANYGVINIKGNYSNQGLESDFKQTNSIVKFIGTGAQSISTNGFAEIFANLVVNKASGALTLNNPINIEQSVEFTSGLINTSATNPLTLMSGATTSPVLGSASSYVNGPIDRQKNTTGSSTLYFPIGKALNWKPVELVVNHNTTASYTYRSEMTNASAAALGWDLQSALQNIVQVSPIRYYDIDRYASLDLSTKTDADLVGSSSVKLTYDTDEFASPSNLIIVKNTGSNQTKWHNIGGAGAVGSSGNITSTGNINNGKTDFTTFSRFALGIFAIPLPVHGYNFTLKFHDNATDLSWKNSGKNFSEVVIEKSLDGKQFYIIGKILKNQQAKEANSNMSFTDFSFISDSYYRLKFEDNKYSETLLAKHTISELRIEISPNPFTQSFTITLPRLQAGELFITDISGKLVYSQTFKEEKTLVLTPNIATGTYILKINTLNNSQVIKLINVN